MPVCTDRPAFTGTLLLTLMVTQGIVNDEIPRTSEKILFADYIQLLTGLCGFITTHHMLIAFGEEKVGERTMMLRWPRQFTVIKAWDIAFLMITLSFFIIITSYAAVMIL